jgi:hypothetical protein
LKEKNNAIFWNILTYFNKNNRNKKKLAVISFFGLIKDKAHLLNNQHQLNEF